MDASSPVAGPGSPLFRAADRHLPVDGLANARDLGGIPFLSGGTTPSGVFFRSENLDQATDRGWEQLYAAGIRNVVDLRQPRERAEDARSRPDWLTTVTVDLDGLENTNFWADYWENGLVSTALYFLPHLAAMPERSGAVLSALATARPGRAHEEASSEALCRSMGTTTEAAFRSALAGLDLAALLSAARLTDAELTALRTWRW